MDQLRRTCRGRPGFDSRIDPQRRLAISALLSVPAIPAGSSPCTRTGALRSEAVIGERPLGVRNNRPLLAQSLQDYRRGGTVCCHDAQRREGWQRQATCEGR
jgi:hypothetical protein